MPRKRARVDGPTRRILSVNPVHLENAVRDVKAGRRSYEKAAHYWAVDKMKIFRAVKRLHQGKIGHPTALSPEEEDAISRFIQKSAEWGFPFTLTDLRLVVKTYLDRKGSASVHLSRRLERPTR